MCIHNNDYYRMYCICWYTVRRNNFEIPSKVAGQNPEVSTGIEIETRRNPSKPVETCHRNPSKPIETHRNLSKSKGFDFCQNWIRVLPRNFNTDKEKAFDLYKIAIKEENNE